MNEYWHTYCINMDPDKENEMKDRYKGEKKMKLRIKIEIFFIAFLLTFLIFNLLVPSGALDLMKKGKKADYEITMHVVVRPAPVIQPDAVI
jgi:hypothetical protein